MKTDHACKKESEIKELTEEHSRKAVLMAEMNTKLNTVIDNQKRSDEKNDQNYKKLEEKIDGIRSYTDSKYATKEEVNNLKQQVLRENDKQDKELSWSKEKIWNLAMQVATVGGLLAIAAKMFGLV